MSARELMTYRYGCTDCSVVFDVTPLPSDQWLEVEPADPVPIDAGEPTCPKCPWCGAVVKLMADTPTIHPTP